MTNTGSEQREELYIDEQADLLEDEMEKDLAENENQGYLMPWLVPGLIIAAFVVVIVLIFLR